MGWGWGLYVYVYTVFSASHLSLSDDFSQRAPILFKIIILSI